MPVSLHDFTVRGIDGQPVPLSRYAGQVVLVVNTASRCGFTPQYEALETLYQRYRERGFAVLGFPANNFLNQEPGTDAEIEQFCRLTYDVSFPMFSKLSVRGRDIAPVFAWLTKQPGRPGDIEWNFAKFLVDGNGHVVARFSPRTDPLSKDVVDRVESLLAPR